MKYNSIICGDAIKELSKIKENTFDLTIFFPPYSV